jgi:hypothetical protein
VKSNPFKDKFIITQTFMNPNKRYACGYHCGVDLVSQGSKNIYAINDGVIANITTNDAYGNSVVQKLPDGHYVRYSHMSKILVNIGAKVIGGVTCIGIEGSTGTSTGDHLDIRITTLPYHSNNVKDYLSIPDYLGFANKVNFVVEVKAEMKNIVVANSNIDEKISWYLAWALNAPLILKENVTQEILANVENIYEVGGTQNISKSKHIGGTNRYDTAQNVLNFINTN